MVDMRARVGCIVTVLSLSACASVKVKGGAAPLEMDQGLLFVEARIDGQGPFWLMLDTGSAQTIVSAEVAARLHLESYGTGGIEGIGGTRFASVGSVRDFEVGGASIGALQVVLGASKRGAKCDGILGGTFLQEFRTTIDYSGQVVTFSRP